MYVFVFSFEMKKLHDEKNLIQGFLICISYRSDHTTRDQYLLQCKKCDYVNFYEVRDGCNV